MSYLIIFEITKTYTFGFTLSANVENYVKFGQQ